MYLCYTYFVIYICGQLPVCKSWEISNNKKKHLRFHAFSEKNSHKISGTENYNSYTCALRASFTNIFVKNQF